MTDDLGTRHHCPSCGTLVASDLLEERADLEREVRRLLARERVLLREMAERRRLDPKTVDVLDVLEAWRVLFKPKARITTVGSRFKATKRVLSSFTVAELKAALAGAKHEADPWRMALPSRKEPEALFRYDGKIEEWVTLCFRAGLPEAEAVRREREAPRKDPHGPAWVLDETGQAVMTP